MSTRAPDSNRRATRLPTSSRDRLPGTTVTPNQTNRRPPTVRRPTTRPRPRMTMTSRPKATTCSRSARRVTKTTSNRRRSRSLPFDCRLGRNRHAYRAGTGDECEPREWLRRLRPRSRNARRHRSGRTRPETTISVTGAGSKYIPEDPAKNTVGAVAEALDAPARIRIDKGVRPSSGLGSSAASAAAAAVARSTPSTSAAAPVKTSSASPPKAKRSSPARRTRTTSRPPCSAASPSSPTTASRRLTRPSPSSPVSPKYPSLDGTRAASSPSQPPWTRSSPRSATRQR